VGSVGPLLNVSGKRGRRYGVGIRRVFDAMLYVTHTSVSGGGYRGISGRGPGCVRSFGAGPRTEPGPGS